MTKRTFATQMCVAVTLIAAVLCSGNARADAPAEGKWFYIISNVSGLNLDVNGGEQWVGNRIVQASPDPLQVWRLIPAEKPGWWYIQSGISGLNLDCFGALKTVGNPVVQAMPDKAQVWQLIDAGDGKYFIQSAVSELYLDDEGGNRDVGNPIVMAERHPQQCWSLKEAADAKPKYTNGRPASDPPPLPPKEQPARDFVSISWRRVDFDSRSRDFGITRIYGSNRHKSKAIVIEVYYWIYEAEFPGERKKRTRKLITAPLEPGQQRVILLEMFEVLADIDPRIVSAEFSSSGK